MTGAYAIVIAVLAVIPIPADIGVSSDWLDKAGHLCEYLLLAWCLMQTARPAGARDLNAMGVAFVLAASYGALLEGVQQWLPYRQAEWWDLVANTVGAGLGAWLGMVIPRTRAH